MDRKRIESGLVVRQTPARPYHRCAQCGCWLDGDYLAKARLATESCPVGRWEGEGCVLSTDGLSQPKNRMCGVHVYRPEAS